MFSIIRQQEGKPLVEWYVRRAWSLRRRYNVYRSEGTIMLQGRKVWHASFRDHDDAIYWVRYGTPDAKVELTIPPLSDAERAELKVLLETHGLKEARIITDEAFNDVWDKADKLGKATSFPRR